MKKVIALTFTFLICISFCSCGGAENTGRNNGNKEITITKEELAKHSEYIELTTENWEEFIEIKKEDVIETDAFGEETGTHTNVWVVLKDGCYVSEDHALRFSCFIEGNDEREFTYDVVFFDNLIDLEGRKLILPANPTRNITCEKVKGTVLKLTLPDDKWNIDEDGNKYLILKGFGKIDDLNVIYDTFI